MADCRAAVSAAATAGSTGLVGAAEDVAALPEASLTPLDAELEFVAMMTMRTIAIATQNHHRLKMERFFVGAVPVV